MMSSDQINSKCSNIDPEIEKFIVDNIQEQLFNQSSQSPNKMSSKAPQSSHISQSSAQ